MIRIFLGLLTGAFFMTGAAFAGQEVTLTDEQGHAIGLSPRQFVTAQVSVTTAATPLAIARQGRAAVTIENTGTTAVYIGGPGVTTTTGMLLPGTIGASVTVQTSAAVYGITASGSQTISVMEAF